MYTKTNLDSSVMDEKVIHVSTTTILKILLFIIGAYLLFLVWDLILILFVALILSALIDPFANWLQARKLPRAIAVVIIYLILFALVGVIFWVVFPLIARDLPALVNNLDQMWDKFRVSELSSKFVSFTNALPAFLNAPEAGTASASSPAFSGVIGTLTNVFGSIFSFVLVLVITFYLVVQNDPVGNILRSVVPDAYVPPVLSTVEQIRIKLALWVRAQLVLSLIIGLLFFVGLSILGVPYAAVLALLAALFEFIPYVGPIGAAIPALFLAFFSGGILIFFLVLALYILVQQFENHVLVPKIMQHAVGLNPVVSILSILAGAKLAGVWGALIAIPVATATSVILRDLLEGKYRVGENKEKV